MMSTMPRTQPTTRTANTTGMATFMLLRWLPVLPRTCESWVLLGAVDDVLVVGACDVVVGLAVVDEAVDVVDAGMSALVVDDEVDAVDVVVVGAGITATSENCGPVAGCSHWPANDM